MAEDSMKTRLIGAVLIAWAGAAWAQVAIVVVLTLNQSAFRPGETLRLGLRFDNPGPTVTADFYTGFLMPDGVTLVFFTNLTPLISTTTRLDADPRTFQPLLVNLQFPQGLHLTFADIAEYYFTGGEVPGSYAVFALLTPPGAFQDGRVDPSDLLSLAVQPFTFSP
jgi:hypothetical protein